MIRLLERGQVCWKYSPVSYRRSTAWYGAFPLIILILGVGLYYSFRTRFLQIRKLGFSLRSIWNKLRQKPEAGGVSPFQAVCTALAATVGTETSQA